MGNRDYKEFGSGEYYHIYNRGNAKQDIFLDDQDFSFFLSRLQQGLFPDNNNDRIRPLPAGSFSLINYCLMPNHFHILLRQNTDLETSSFILRVCTSYAKYFNRKYEKVGHVFQDQFKQVRVDNNSYLLWLSAYIHQNPTVAGLVKHPAEYPWSSHADFVGMRDGRICQKEPVLSQFQNIQEYKKFVDDSLLTIKERKDFERFLFD